MPVYGAADELRACLASLVRHTDLGRHRLVLVIDGPQEPAVEAVLATVADRPAGEVLLLRNPVRRGFVGSVNAGMAASERDVVLLNSDTEVTAGWLAKLQQAAFSHPAIATVTPFSNNATIASLPRFAEVNLLPVGWDADRFGALVERVSARERPRLPTGVGVCLYIKRQALDRLGLFDEAAFGLGYGEESDFCFRALKAGLLNVLDDATFIYHAGQRSFGASRTERVKAAHRAIGWRHPEYLPTVARFLREDPLKPARERVVEELRRGRRATAPGTLTLRAAGRVLRAEGIAALRDRIADRLLERRRRRSFQPARSPLDLPPIPVLNLLPTAPTPRLGGIQAQLLSRVEIEAKRRPLALLYPEAAGYRLEVAAAGRRLSLAYGDGTPPSPIALRDEAFERAVARAAAEVGARALHVEGLSSIPLGSLWELHRSGLQLVLSVHDFSLFCPRPHLLESPEARFCGYCRDLDRCARCLGQDWPVGAPFQAERRELARELLLAAAAVVYPSDFLRRQHRELFPGLPAERQRVIEPSGPHGAGAPDQEAGPVRHVAYIGQVQPHKGAGVFEEVVRRLPAETNPDLRWSAYGGGDVGLLMHLRRLPDVRVRGYYRSGSLTGLLRRDRVDLALLLSIVPESYSLVLSECLAAGVPVVAFDHGAIAERLRRHGGGLLVEPSAGAAGIASVVASLTNGARIPRNEIPRNGSPPFPDAAVAAFQELYRELGLS